MSAHDAAVATLESWPAPDAAQAALAADYLDHLRAHADALSRTCFPRHLTAGAVILSDDRDSVLLNLHAKSGRWFHFGGHVEPADAGLAEAARRETVEESGLSTVRFTRVPVQLSTHEVPFCDSRGTVDHLDVRYAGLVPTGSVPAPSTESLAVRWFPIDRLPTDEPEMRALIGAAREVLADPAAVT